MFNVSRGVLLLACSVAYISGAETRHKVYCLEPNFEGKAHEYSVWLSEGELGDKKANENIIKNIGFSFMQAYLAEEEKQDVIENNRINGSEVDLYCLDLNTGKRVELDLLGLRTGTHQLRATVVRKKGTGEEGGVYRPTRVVTDYALFSNKANQPNS
jgi:hypothetical protein